MCLYMHVYIKRNHLQVIQWLSLDGDKIFPFFLLPVLEAIYFLTFSFFSEQYDFNQEKIIKHNLEILFTSSSIFPLLNPNVLF